MAGGIRLIASLFAAAIERKLNRNIFWRDPLNRKLSIYVSCIAKGGLTIELYESSRSIGRPIAAMFYPLLKKKEGRIWMFIN